MRFYNKHIQKILHPEQRSKKIGVVKDGKYSTQRPKYGGIGQALANAPGNIITVRARDRTSGKVTEVKALKLYDPVSGQVVVQFLPERLTNG